LILSLLLRLVLWWQFGAPEGVLLSALPPILIMGASRDLLVLVFLLSPLVALLTLLPAGCLNRSWLNWLLGSFAFLLLFGLTYLPFVEYYFFQEFDSRFNLVAVDYLIYPHEVLVNIWESYPVGWALFVAAVMAFLLQRAWWPTMQQGLRFARSWKERSFMLTG